ncbi:MAG: leucine-rich repeat domain-containing protein [Bdellovibrionales bacterium]|nr:leucine-rich repeat domain-containing protein [Bdellovibrionales bacterium]
MKTLAQAFVLSMFVSTQGYGAARPFCDRTPQVVFRILSLLPEADYDCRAVTPEMLSSISDVGSYGGRSLWWDLHALNIHELKAGDFDGIRQGSYISWFGGDFSGNFLSRIESRMIPNVPDLNFSHNQLRYLGVGAIPEGSLSKRINLSHNRLDETSFEEGWARAAEVEKADLSHNLIRQIVPAMIPPPDFIESNSGGEVRQKMNFSWNQITALPASFVDLFPRDRIGELVLDFDHNQLKSIDGPIVSDLGKVCLEISYESNQIESLSSGLFEIPEQQKYWEFSMNLNRNRLTRIPALLFRDRNRVRHNFGITLSFLFEKNQIREVSAPAFESVNRTPLSLYISFRDNQLEDFPAGYVDLSVMKYFELDLRGNPLSEAVKSRLRAEYGNRVLLD